MFRHMAQALLAAAVALPLAAALVVTVAGRALGERSLLVALGATVAAFAAAVGVLAVVAASGPFDLVAADAGGNAQAGFTATELTAALAVVVLGVSAVVQGFARRHLQGDPRLPTFASSVALATAATVAMICAATLTGFAAGWIVAGLALLRLLGLRAELPAARAGRRRAAAAFAIGDGALLLAVVLIVATVGDLDLRDVGAGADALGSARVDLGFATVAAGPLAAGLLIVAALARCAQLPLHRWLIGTVAAPTAVSAFLHAGLVNAGGVLLVRFGPVVGIADWAPYVVFALGAATAVAGTAMMLVRSDIKGSLAHSTMGQMGFMVLQCGLGAPAAAMLHLAGHAMYKATLFLGSGSAVSTRRRWAARRPQAPGPFARRRVRAALALLLPAAALGAVAAAATPILALDAGAVLLLAFAWVSGVRAADGWLRAAPLRPGGAVAAAGAALVVAATGYVLLLAGAKAFLDPALPDLAGVPAWLAAPVLLAIVVATAATVAGPPAGGRLDGLAARAYVRLGRAGALAPAPAAAWARPSAPVRPSAPAGLAPAPSRGAS